MPLINKKPFQPYPIPENLGPDDEVFYLDLTNEIFTSHDEFFDRFLYCNSLIWTCGRTGKSGLTYKEALDSEQQIFNRRKRVKKEKPQHEPQHEVVKVNHSSSDLDSHDKTTDGSEPTKKKKKKYPYDPKKYSMPVPDGFDPSLLTPTGKIDGRKLKSKKNQQLAEELLAASGYDPTQKKKQLSSSSPDTQIGKKSKKKRNKEEEARRKEEEAQKKAQMQAELAKERELEAKKKKEAATLAKQLERQKKEEERKKAAAFLQSWEKKCEDLERDDLRRLPQPTPVDCDIPERLFGDAVFILESLYNLHELYHLGEIFPEGVNYDMLEEMLLDRREDGALSTITQFLLRLIFDTQPTGDGYGLDDDPSRTFIPDSKVEGANVPNDSKMNDNSKMNHVTKVDQNGTDVERHENEANGIGSDAGEPEPDDHDDEDEEMNKEVRMNDLIGSAIKAAQEVRKSLGKPLPEMAIESSNVTEILRLHLLQSGSFPKGRTIYNGWYSSREDPGLWLCMQEPDLIKKLGEVSIFELGIEDRIKILHTLIYQLFTFIKTRLYIESASEQLTELRKKYRYEAATFGRWDRENCVKRMQDSDQPSQPEGEEEQMDAESKAQMMQQNQVDYDDYQRERAIRQEQLNQTLLLIRSNLRSIQAIYGIHPIGRDRAYRRYWLFQSLPGLFVEQDDDYIGKCLPQPTPLESQYKKLFNKDNPLMHPNEADLIRAKTCDVGCSTQQKLAKDLSHEELDTDGKKNENSTNGLTQPPSNTESGDHHDHDDEERDHDENGLDADGNHHALDDKLQNTQQNGQDLHDDQDEVDNESSGIAEEMNFCTGDEVTCAIHGQKRLAQPRWWFYNTPESIDTLIESLNKRGYRESKLQDALAAESSLIKPLVSSCPAHKLNRHILELSGIRRSRRLRTKGNKRRGRKDYD